MPYTATPGQSWSSFYGEVGDAAYQLGQQSPAWGFAMDHPYVTGAGVGITSGVAAYGTAAVITQASVGINLGRLSQLPMESRVDTIANRGFDAIQNATGLSKSGAMQTIQSAGKSLVDMRPGNIGNINTISNIGDKAIRVTTNPTATKIISSGVMTASKIPGYISSGAMQSLPTITSIAKSITQVITNLLK